MNQCWLPLQNSETREYLGSQPDTPEGEPGIQAVIQAINRVAAILWHGKKSNGLTTMYCRRGFVDDIFDNRDEMYHQKNAKTYCLHVDRASENDMAGGNIITVKIPSPRFHIIEH